MNHVQIKEHSNSPTSPQLNPQLILLHRITSSKVHASKSPIDDHDEKVLKKENEGQGKLKIRSNFYRKDISQKRLMSPFKQYCTPEKKSNCSYAYDIDANEKSIIDLRNSYTCSPLKRKSPYQKEVSTEIAEVLTELIKYRQ